MLNATVFNLKGRFKTMLWLKSSQVLALSNPLSLLLNVWFHIILFFYRRGREGQRTLKTTSFKFEVDPAGCNYATMAHDEATKNHSGGIADVSSPEKVARMYDTDDVNDGYRSLKLSKLNPKSESFSQYPRKNWSFDDNIWYEARPVGIGVRAGGGGGEGASAPPVTEVF